MTLVIRSLYLSSTLDNKIEKNDHKGKYIESKNPIHRVIVSPHYCDHPPNHANNPTDYKNPKQNFHQFFSSWTGTIVNR